MRGWLVTGAGGLLGANAGAFLAERADVTGLVRPGGARSRSFAVHEAVDLTDHASVTSLIAALRPGVILHTAAVSRHETCERSPETAYTVNVEASRNLARAAQAAGSTLVYISTDAVFDGSVGVYSEEDEPRPFSIYGQTKLEGEFAVAEETDALVVRTNFFGWSPSGTSSILEYFYNSLSAGVPVKGFTDFHVTSMYVQHLMRAVWRLVECEARGVVHVASRDRLSKYEFAVAVADVFSLDASLISPSAEEHEPREWAKGRDISLDTNLFTRITGESTPSQAEGLSAACRDLASLRIRVLEQPESEIAGRPTSEVGEPSND